MFFPDPDFLPPPDPADPITIKREGKLVVQPSENYFIFEQMQKEI